MMRVGVDTFLFRLKWNSRQIRKLSKYHFFVSRHQTQHYTNQLAKETTSFLKELAHLPQPPSASDQVRNNSLILLNLCLDFTIAFKYPPFFIWLKIIIIIMYFSSFYIYCKLLFIFCIWPHIHTWQSLTFCTPPKKNSVSKGWCFIFFSSCHCYYCIFTWQFWLF